MKMFLISDNDDTLTGMRLAGIAGTIAHTREDVKDLIDQALNDKDIAILVVTEKINQIAQSDIDAVKLNKKMPLIAVIPDRHGTNRPKDFITQYVREAIGIKL